MTQHKRLDIPTPTHQGQSAFLILNVWREELEGGRIVWRGKTLDVDSGSTRDFDDWPEMVELIADALDGRAG